MISGATKRTILRVVHLIVTIPILGYIYGKPSEVEQYGDGVRNIFVPIIILSGYWMYSGFVFAIIGVALWLGAFHLFGYGGALLSQVLLFIGRKVWMVVRGKRRPAARSLAAGESINEPQKSPG